MTVAAHHTITDLHHLHHHGMVLPGAMVGIEAFPHHQAKAAILYLILHVMVLPEVIAVIEVPLLATNTSRAIALEMQSGHHEIMKTDDHETRMTVQEKAAVAHKTQATRVIVTGTIETEVGATGTGTENVQETRETLVASDEMVGLVLGAPRDGTNAIVTAIGTETSIRGDRRGCDDDSPWYMHRFGQGAEYYDT
jgi:hypothetical protein